MAERDQEMLSAEDIITTALREHENEADLPKDVKAFTEGIKLRLEDVTQIPAFSRTSPPLSLVKFKCLLQDTSYPLEVYMPGEAGSSGNVMKDMSKLKERFVGWATGIPGEQAWSRSTFEDGINGLSLSNGDHKLLPELVRNKHAMQNKGDYTGALAKVYADASYKPSSLLEIIGLVSTSPMPAQTSDNEDEEPIMVPCIHVLLPPKPAFPPITSLPTTPSADQIRSDLISYISRSFDTPDPLVAEFIFLVLVTHLPKSSTAKSSKPQTSLSLNILASNSSTLKLETSIGSIYPIVANLPLSLSVLHESTFHPTSPDSTSLNAGTLQLGKGTVLIVDENQMGEGGMLQEKAVKNLQTLSDCIKDGQLKYEYPYMDNLRMEWPVKTIVLSEGKSLLPVDIQIPLLQSDNSAARNENGKKPATEEQLSTFRQYIAHMSTREINASAVPEETIKAIEDDFVNIRKNNPGEQLEIAMKRHERRIKTAKALAWSYAHPTLTTRVWSKAVEMDEQVEQRLLDREKANKSVSKAQTKEPVVEVRE